jgi:hypothetical protein
VAGVKVAILDAELESGIELVWYWHGRKNPDTGERYGSKYICHLDRWALMAIDRAIVDNGGNFSIRDEQLRKACAQIASSVARNPTKQPSNTEGGEMDSEVVALEKKVRGAGKRYGKLVEELKQKMEDARYPMKTIQLKLKYLERDLKRP